MIRRTVIRWLRLPADPAAPEGSAGSVRVFHAAPGYFHYACARWALRQAGVLLGVLFAFVIGHQFFDWMAVESVEVTQLLERVPAGLVSWAEWLHLVDIRAVPDSPGVTRISWGPGLFWFEVIGLALVAVQLPLSYTLMRLDYELRFYIVTDRSLRIREGITSLRESTMTFDNIQNISVRQGPIQRMFGIADLRVRTAGGGSGEGHGNSGEGGKEADSMHVGYFRGVDNAEALRDTILRRLRSLADAGLGGRDEAPPAAPASVGSADAPPAVLAAARRVLGEARALRRHLAP